MMGLGRNVFRKAGFLRLRLRRLNNVKSIQLVMLRNRVAIIPALSFSSPHPYAGYGDLVGVGRP